MQLRRRALPCPLRNADLTGVGHLGHHLTLMAATKEIHVRRMPVELWQAVRLAAEKKRIPIYEYVVLVLAKAVNHKL